LDNLLSREQYTFIRGILAPMRNILRAAILLASVSCAVWAADVTGKWKVTLELSGVGSFTPAFEFKQDGEKLTGKYSGGLGNADVTGTVKGDQIEFHFTGEYNGEALKVVYTGTIEGDGKMKGTAKMGELAEGSWTGERQQ
jgi:hypothetical protein